MSHAEKLMPPQREPKKAAPRCAKPPRGFGGRALCVAQDLPAQPAGCSPAKGRGKIVPTENPLAQGGSGDGLVRSEAEAWKIVGENRGLIRVICDKYGLKKGLGPEDWPKVTEIVELSLAKSALGWKEENGSFATYAIASAIGCKVQVARLGSEFSVGRTTLRRTRKFFALRRRRPGYTVEEFASEHDIGAKGLDYIRKAIRSMNARKRFIDGSRIFNGGLDEDMGSGWKRQSAGLRDLEFHNPLDLHGRTEEEADLGHIRERLVSALEGVLSPQELELLLMRYGIGEGNPEPMELAELGRAFPARNGKSRSKQAVNHQLDKLFERISGSECAGELRGLLEMLE
ncbi:hypothetical protein JW721_05500 [Candidatus Micrarchaeota archaeon]|nr:hypothetical protein [Candidatus Micrarchaeota archaeon]